MSEVTLAPENAEQDAVVGTSLWKDAYRRLKKNTLAVLGFVVVCIVVLASAVGPWIIQRATGYTYDYIPTDPALVTSQPPFTAPDGTFAWTHPMGTDDAGRDILARVLLGGRISLMVGVISTLVSLIIGIAVGATAGYLGGRVDEAIMRLVDVLYSIPYMMVVIVLLAFFGGRSPISQLFLLFVALGAVSWLTMARIVRGQTLSVKQKEFVEAARAGGVGTFGIIFRHIVPNVFGPVIVYVTLTVPASILAESFLSYLGLGIQEPLTSWGVLIKDGADQMETAPWTLLFPAAFMAITLFCFNFIGDGLRDALDPKDR